MFVHFSQGFSELIAIKLPVGILLGDSVKNADSSFDAISVEFKSEALHNMVFNSTSSVHLHFLYF
jgi:hypothetical protein